MAVVAVKSALYRQHASRITVRTIFESDAFLELDVDCHPQQAG